MVDVGYCINGKHGVIWSVIPISNTKTEHLCFIKANGEEQYALKKEDIEYVIPSDSYLSDGSVVTNDEGRFDYNVVYTIDGVMRYHSVPKWKLADVIADAFASGSKTVSIGRVEREDDNT